MTELEQRVTALEKRVGKPNRPAPGPREPTLAECNEIAQKAWAELKAQKRDAKNVAVAAIESAFKSQAGKTIQRPQKAASPVAAELTAKVAKK